MEIINSILTWVMKKRIHQMEFFMKYPLEVQDELRRDLLSAARQTEFGLRHNFDEIINYEDFRRKIPLMTYEDLHPYVERIMRGEQNVLWPTPIKWFSKSSGTTNSRSKFIPVSQEALDECHFKGGKDLMSIYVNNYPDTHVFSGKGLAVGGSLQVNNFDPTNSSHFGDVSAVIMQNLPAWAQLIRTPSLETALMTDWEEKIDKLARETARVNVTYLAGVPTWTVLLLQHITRLEGKRHILEIWPNLEVFFHGAVAFQPYRQLFKSLIPGDGMRYWETYNASEGFFGIQDQRDSEDLLLMLDYGVFYEFIPVDGGEHGGDRAIGLDEVEVGKNYAMVITTNAGLWRYQIGDTVRFTCKTPFRIRISGRTKQFMNAFGEEVIVENAETAITRACEATGAVITNFTAAPIYLEEGKRGGHEWIIEFRTPPSDIGTFNGVLDDTLRRINSDYDAKRAHDLALVAPVIHPVAENTFYNWMKRRGKLGGQYKVPRLSNSREYVDDLLAMIRP